MWEDASCSFLCRRNFRYFTFFSTSSVRDTSFSQLSELLFYICICVIYKCVCGLGKCVFWWLERQDENVEEVYSRWNWATDRRSSWIIVKKWKLPFSACTFFSSRVALTSWTSQRARVSRQRNAELCPNWENEHRCSETQSCIDLQYKKKKVIRSVQTYTPPLFAPKGCLDFPFCQTRCPDVNGQFSQEGQTARLWVALHAFVLNHLALPPTSLSVLWCTCMNPHTKKKA